MNEPIRVSDGSQKYKIGLGVVGLLLLAALVFGGNNGVLGGMTPDQGTFGLSGVRNGQVTCTSTSGTLVGTSTNRLSFMAANMGANLVYLCRAQICTATSGIPLAVTSTTQQPFVQDDGYVGPYTCVTALTGSNVNYSQGQ